MTLYRKCTVCEDDEDGLSSLIHACTDILCDGAVCGSDVVDGGLCVVVSFQDRELVVVIFARHDVDCCPSLR